MLPAFEASLKQGREFFLSPLLWPAHPTHPPTLPLLDLFQVLDLKKSIQASQGHEAASIKLIQTGKILSDDSATLEAAGVKDSSSGQFVVVMVSKAKAAVPATAAPSATGAAAPPPVPPPASSAAAPPAAPAPPAAAAPTQQQQQQQPQGNPFEGPDFTSHIELLKGMGLTTDESILKNALIAAFNNPDRAVEYLLGGIPEGALARGLAHGKQQQGGGGAGAGAGTGGGKSSGGGSAGAPAPRTYPAGAHPATLEGGALFALRNHPQLTAIRTAIKTSPSNIPMAINAIAQVMPELASAIEANKDAFLQLMNEPEPVAGEVAGGGEMELGEEGEEEGDDMDEAAMLGGQSESSFGGGVEGMLCVQCIPPHTFILVFQVVTPLLSPLVFLLFTLPPFSSHPHPPPP